MNTKRRGRRFVPSLKAFVQRLSCRACTFTGPLRAHIGVRTSDDECGEIARESLERASIRILSRRYRKTKKTVMKIIHRVLSQLPTSADIAEKFCPAWSNILVFDGKVIRVYDHASVRLDLSSFTDDERRWMHKMRWLAGVDYGTGDLPHYALADSENKIDLVLYFQNLKSLKYRLVALICDGNPLIPEAAKFVYGNHIIVQRCTRHFLEDLRRLLPNAVECPDERAALEQLIFCIKRVIEADTIEKAGDALLKLHAYAPTCASPIKRTMLAMLKRAKVELTAHLLHPEFHLPHTTNDIENLFKQLMLRLKSIGRFFHQDYARDYLNAWALLRRFTPFTDCRGHRKGRNKKAPLQLAGCEIENIDPLKLRKTGT